MDDNAQIAAAKSGEGGKVINPDALQKLRQATINKYKQTMDAFNRNTGTDKDAEQPVHATTGSGKDGS